MSKKYLISILIPTLIERREVFNKLIDNIHKQIKDNRLEDLVEIISICDNRNIKLSEKRNRAQQMAQGKYFFHLDDDDTIADNYCKTVCDIIKRIDPKKYPDVITYDQLCKVNGNRFIVTADLKEKFTLRPVDLQNNIQSFTRVPWQYHLWRTEKYAKIWRTDSDTNAREDQNWLKKIYLEYPKTQHHIKKILHTYNFGTDGVETTTQ